jgi:hypothetical protein
MGNKVSLPDGAWAVLRDPESVTERQRRPLIRLRRRMLGSSVGERLLDSDLSSLPTGDALRLLQPVIGSDDFNLLEEIDDLIIAILVESWSFDAEPSVESVLDLPASVRRALIAECKPLVGPLVGEASDEDVLNPDSPTEPASGSDRQ